jgi:hypothetical protein
MTSIIHIRRLFATFAVGSLALLLSGAPAHADFGLQELDVTFSNQDASPATQAGSHPFSVSTTFGVNTEEVTLGKIAPVDAIRDLIVRLPPGFAGDPTAVPQCSSIDFAKVDKELSQPACSSATAIGIARLQAEFDPVETSKLIGGRVPYTSVPVYNLTPPPGSVAQFGFLVLNVPVTVDIRVSQSPPYNVYAVAGNTSQAALLFGAQLTIWGNPADPVHDPIRGRCLDAVKSGGDELISLGNCEAGVPERPFITLPRSCQGPLVSFFEATAWGVPGAPATGTATTAGMEGCDQLDFGPEIEVEPSTAAASSPAGLDFSIDVDDPNLVDPDENAASDVRKVVATLPEGMTLNPSSANGLEACTPAQFAAVSIDDRGCPGASKLGTVHVTTPLLQQALDGALYVAQPDDPAAPGAENPFDSLLAVYLVIKNPELGILVKQAGKVEPDPATGQVTTTFDDIPQFPLSHVGVHFREGPRAPLVTPSACGTYSAEAELTPWSGTAPVTSESSFTIDTGPGGAPCPASGSAPFAPGFEAGSTDNTAGSFSPFYIRVTRKDGEQELTRFDSILPPGLTGKLAGIPTCSDLQIAAAALKSGRAELAEPSCPEGSQLGRIVAGAGAGDELTYVGGKIYLAGPFGGDPLSIAVVTPAVAGPFDVGTVVTRESLDLDPNTAEVQVSGAASTPIPHILEGVPLHLRDLRVFVDRPGFTLNPTSCEPKLTKASLFGSGADLLGAGDDSPAAVSAPYQAANCGNLAFKPPLKLQLKGGMKRNGHPALKSVLTPRPGDANIGRAVVTLPPSEFIDNDHINNPCTRVQFAAGQCPKSSVLGTAKAVSPLLDQPLEGPVYFRSNGGERLLPDIVADLHGQFHIVLVGFVDSKKKRIRTTFATVPDAPVSKFTLSLYGGKRGLLVNSRNLCVGKLRANLLFTGQNGRPAASNPVIGTSCKNGKAKTRKGR